MACRLTTLPPQSAILIHDAAFRNGESTGRIRIIPFNAPSDTGVFLIHLRAFPGFQSTIFLQRFLPQLIRPLLQLPLSSLASTIGESIHHLFLEPFLKVLFLLEFEVFF